jgi:hypothetical protein
MLFFQEASNQTRQADGHPTILLVKIIEVHAKLRDRAFYFLEYIFPKWSQTLKESMKYLRFPYLIALISLGILINVSRF